MEFVERYGPWALVTGASSGIGAGFARALAARGLSCVLTARRLERLEELARQLESSCGVDTRTLAQDLAEPGAAERLRASVEDLEIGLLVNNAGFGQVRPFLQQEPERIRQMITVNCTAPVLLARGLLPSMAERGRGGMVVVTSSAGYQPIPYFALYAGVKACSLLWGEGVWHELRSRGVDVLNLAPGTTVTEFQAVAGQEPHGGASVESVVEAALKSLGRRPTITPGFKYWFRCWLTRFVPRKAVPPVSARFSGWRGEG